MKQIHNKLLKHSPTYATWHEHPHHKKVHWGAFVIVALILGLFVLKGVEKWRNVISNFVMIEFRLQSAILTLDPQKKSVVVGDIFTVNVVLDTAGKPIDGVDLYSLHYDPTILNVIDDMPTKSGIQIMPGNIMDINVVNDAEQATGTIKFSQVSTVGTNFSGKGVLASIHFKAVGKGDSFIKFDFSLGSTKDTNVAHNGKDQLLNVVDALYTVTE